MRIAIFLQNLNFEAFQSATTVREVLLFNVRDTVIDAIGVDRLLLANVDYLLLWLLSHKVETVYLDRPEPSLKANLERAGLAVKFLKEIKENPVYRAFLIGGLS
jgi:hypothetical protein